MIKVTRIGKTQILGDNIFRDDYNGQLLKISGDPGSGYVGTIVVGI